MSKISTLLATLALAAPTILVAQGPKKVASSAQINATVTYDAIRQQQLAVERPNLVNAKPVIQHHQVLSPNGKVAAVAPIQLGTASNGLSSIRSSQNQVTNVDSLGTVAFIHRQDINIWGGGTTENGRYRYDISIDGGATFTNDIGPLQTVYTNYGRYPQMSTFNNSGTSNPFDAKFVWNGPTNRFPTPGWVGHVYGLSSVTTSSPPTSTEHYLFDNELTLLPGGLTQGLPGEYWTVDFQFDGTDITDTILLYKGVWNSGTSDIDWAIYSRLVPGYDMTGDGSRVGIGPNLAFSEDGQHGWLAIVSNIGTDPKNTTLFPVFYHSSDGGATWGAATEVDLDQFPWVIDSLQSLWVDSLGNPASSGQATAAFEYDLVVDNNGDVHMGLVVGTTGAGQAFSISSGLAKFFADVHSTGAGTGWDMTYIAPVLTFRGTFGAAHNQDNYPQVSRNKSGSIIFYSWVDSDTAQFTGSMNGVGFGTADNVAPNLRIATRRILDGAMAYPKLVTDGDLIWEGRMLAPTMAPVVHQVGQRFELPIVGMEFLQNDENLPVQYWYFGKDAFFDFGGTDQWCNPAMMDLGWSSWGFPGATPTCAVGNNVAVENGIVLHQSFPNPSNGSAVIRFILPNASNVEMDLVNMYGQTIATLAQGQHNSGIHDVVVETNKLAAGVYFYNLRAEGKVFTKKMIVTK